VRSEVKTRAARAADARSRVAAARTAEESRVAEQRAMGVEARASEAKALAEAQLAYAVAVMATGHAAVLTEAAEYRARKADGMHDRAQAPCHHILKYTRTRTTHAHAHAHAHRTRPTYIATTFHITPSTRPITPHPPYDLPCLAGELSEARAALEQRSSEANESDAEARNAEQTVVKAEEYRVYAQPPPAVDRSLLSQALGPLSSQPIAHLHCSPLLLRC
jgi:hypothetical protein